MAWCRHALSYYLSRFWPRSRSPFGVTRLHWVNQYASLLQLTDCHNIGGTKDELNRFKIRKKNVKIYKHPWNLTFPLHIATDWMETGNYIWMNCCKNRAKKIMCSILPGRLVADVLSVRRFGLEIINKELLRFLVILCWSMIESWLWQSDPFEIVSLSKYITATVLTDKSAKLQYVYIW